LTTITKRKEKKKRNQQLSFTLQEKTKVQEEKIFQFSAEIYHTIPLAIL